MSCGPTRTSCLLSLFSKRAQLLDEGDDITDQDTHELWDDDLGSVPGGINWATDYADNLDNTSFIGISGPDLGEQRMMDF